jgi:hypothetical protein
MPRQTKLSQSFLQRGKFCLSSVHHNSVLLNPLYRQLLGIMDGATHKRNAMDRLLENDEPALQRYLEKHFGNPVNESSLEAKIDEAVEYLARHGLLQP